jgi:hypothetical protein
MTTWTDDELTRITTAEELRLTPLRGDGRPDSRGRVWFVREGGDLYVRSVSGRLSDWYRSTRVRPKGRVRVGRVAKDVVFVDADPGLNGRIDAAYRTKYGHYATPLLKAITSPEAAATTLRLVPRPACTRTTARQSHPGC